VNSSWLNPIGITAPPGLYERSRTPHPRTRLCRALGCGVRNLSQAYAFIDYFVFALRSVRGSARKCCSACASLRADGTFHCDRVRGRTPAWGPPGRNWLPPAGPGAA